MNKEKLLYTGVELDETSREKLRKFCHEDWTDYRHHMTIQFGRVMAEDMEDWLDENLGREFEMKVVAYGENIFATAVMVETDVPSLNKIKHITVSVDTKGGGRPVMSNMIENWETLSEPIILTGVVKAFKKGMI